MPTAPTVFQRAPIKGPAVIYGKGGFPIAYVPDGEEFKPCS